MRNERLGRRPVPHWLLGMTLLLALAAAGCASATEPPPGAGERTAAAPQAAAGRGSADATNGTTTGGSGQGGGSVPAQVDRMIVYTAQVGLRVVQLGGGVDAVSAIAERFGGYVSGSSRSEAGTPTASVTIRIPAQNFQAAMAAVRAAGDRVLSENVTSQDVTEQFADLNAQLRGLQATEAQYLELLRRANTVDELLKVQQQLGAVRTQIERIQGQINAIARRADLATITVTMTERPPVAVGDVWEPGRVIDESFQASLTFLQALATATLRVAVFFWWLCIPVVVATVILVLVLRRRGSRTVGQSG